MKLGIALSGGGVKGAIHLGIIHALEDHGIHADMYAGTSAGAIVASAKALGMSNAETLQLLTQINKNLLDFDYWGILLGIPTKFAKLESIMRGKKLKQFLHRNFDYNMDDLKYPLSIISADMNTGAQVIFSSENLNLQLPPKDRVEVYREGLRLDEMIYCSAAIQGIYPPYNWGLHKMSDGSIVNNMPTNVLNIMGADKILGINISFKESFDEVQGVMNLMNKSLSILIDQNVDYALSSSKNYMCVYPDLTGISPLDFDKANEGYARGYVYGESIATEVQLFLEGTV
jgi:NTE family protein